MARFKEKKALATVTSNLVDPEALEEAFALGGDELSPREELYEIAEIYGEADVQEKSAKATKDRVKGPMLELMSEVVREEIPLARQVIEVENDEASRYDYDYEKWCAAQYPEWRVVGLLPSEGKADVTIEERDDLKKFEFVVNGKKYGRTVAMVGADFDAEGLYEYEDGSKAAELAREAVTRREVIVYEFDEKKAQAIMAEFPETLAIFEEFTSIGVPQVRMIPIKEIKEEE